LEKLTHNQRRDIDELMERCRVEEFYRWGLGGIQQKRVGGIEAVRKHNKLMILGKPGAGKTTFLKFLAVASINKDVFANLLPIFVTLKDFADQDNRPSLLQLLIEEFRKWEVEIEPILKSGKALILLDGLDEVRAEYDDRVLREIREFARNYSQNQIVLTCRIASKQYLFEQFTEVEVADFDEKQIVVFAKNWFRYKQIKVEDFLKDLEKNCRVQELATSPLLLTLLCLVFEDSGFFPANRAELYKEGLDALLRKWDAKRGIRRDSVYKDLSIQKKEDMLSQIALTTFEKGDYFIKQTQLEDYICKYIRNTSNANTDVEELHLDSEAVLKSLEAQHGLFVERARGIYSFSHLTFHEYFTARQIVISTSPSKLASALHKLVTHVTDKRWREVILLSIGMAKEADDLFLLMKQEIDNLLIEDKILQNFLSWVDEKARSVTVLYKPAAVRANYFAFNSNFSLELVIDKNFSCDFDREYGLYRDYAIYRTRTRYITNTSYLPPDIAIDLALNLALGINLDFTLDLKFVLDRAISMAQEINDKRLHESLKSFKYQEANLHTKEAKIRWNENLRQLMIEYRNIGHDRQFNENQKEKLKQYYNANIFLMECLNSDCYVSRETRQKIEESLLLPSVSSKR
jgi:predicted NACHT family NTPase